MNKFILSFFIILISVTSVNSKTTTLITIIPTFKAHFDKNHEIDFVKVTLFNSDRSKKLIIQKNNSCDQFKINLNGYTGEFIFLKENIKYTEVKIEHPRFTTIFSKLNTMNLLKDSIDIFNKRNHILIYKTIVILEKACDTKPEYDFLFSGNNDSQGGYFFRNQIGVLLHDTLSPKQIKKFSNKFKIDVIDKDSTNTLIRFKTRDWKVKDGKNKIISLLLLDSSIVKDAGVIIDTIENAFLSSFIKVASLPIKDIEKFNFLPISGLKKLTSEMKYIKNKKLAYGCGLYRCKIGLGYELFEIQKNIKVKMTNKKCSERDELKDLELEYFKIQTYNLSSSGGKYSGKKREHKKEKMVKIYKREQKIKPCYFAKTGRISFNIINNTCL